MLAKTLKEKAIYLIQHPKSDEEPKTVPTLKEIFNLNNWAYRNKLFVHPAYRQAVKRKENVLIIASIIVGVLAGVILTLVVFFW